MLSTARRSAAPYKGASKTVPVRFKNSQTQIICKLYSYSGFLDLKKPETQVKL